MRFEHTVTVEASAADVEAFLADVPAVARCVPGVEDVAEIAPGVYEGRLRLRVGPLSLAIAGRGELERDADGAWRLRAAGRDARIGAGADATLEARLAERADAVTDVAIVADVQFSGRLAELGQALIRRKADAMVRDFAANFARAF